MPIHGPAPTISGSTVWTSPPPIRAIIAVAEDPFDPDGINAYLDDAPARDGFPDGPPELDDIVIETRGQEPAVPVAATGKGVSLTDFYAYMPTHGYIFAPTGEFWPAASVNSQIRPLPQRDRWGNVVVGEDKKPKFISASAWLDKEKPVVQMTWAPGEPQILQDRLISEGGWIRRPDCACFNLYRPPQTHPGDPSQARRWVDHVMTVYPDEASHIIAWLAHRVQRPQEKINHALVLGGNQGVGKDTILEPVKYAIGSWNFSEVSPANLLGRFNGFLRSVIMRVSEARDLGDVDRFAFYDHMKTYTAAPPDVLRVDEKHIREYNIFNVVGVIITSNHKSDGIYLPADDRRHYVAWSDLTKESFDEQYWRDLYAWYHDEGGLRHVAAYLRGLDISTFNPKAPPPKTEAFWSIVDANRAPENSDMADAIDRLGRPDALTKEDIADQTADPEFREWMRNRRNARALPHRLEECGYVAVRNRDTKDHLWVISGKRVQIYAKHDLSIAQQCEAAQRRTGRAW